MLSASQFFRNTGMFSVDYSAFQFFKDNYPSDELIMLDQAAMWTSLGEMSLLLIALTVTMIRVCRKNRFRFLIILISLLIVADIAVAFLSVGLYCEQTDLHNNHPLPLAILIGTTTFFFNMGNNTMHWLFALKYWIIAREVPKLFHDQQIKFSEKIYKTVKITGFVVNFIPCGFLAYYRGKLTMESAGRKTPSRETVDAVQILYQLNTAIELVSAFILADALRRIRKALKRNPFLQGNQKIMWLHIVMLTTHVVVISLAAFFVFRAFQYPENTKYQYEQSASRIALFSSMTVVQLIIIYLFQHFG